MMMMTIKVLTMLNIFLFTEYVTIYLLHFMSFSHASYG